MRNARTGIEYSVKGSSWLDRTTAWSRYMDVADFVVPTDNPYLTPTEYYTVFYKGDLRDGENVLTRVQSACVLGRIWGLDDCDCNRQLLTGFRLIEREQNGLFVYCSDDHGKGVGLANHFRTLVVEKFRGLNEDDARAYLGLKDARDYKPVIVITDHFGVKGVRLLTNNESKLDIFRKYSIPAEQVSF